MAFPAGHFYSPLLDLQSLRPGEFAPPFPFRQIAGHRYFVENGFFVPSDAFTLSGIIRREQPRRVVEVGSGFSSAVMLDTLDHAGQSADLTFIEPFPDRLNALLTAADRARSTVLVQPVQSVPLAVFDRLEERGIP